MKYLVIIVGLTLTVLCLALYIFEPHIIRAVSHAGYDMLLRAHGGEPASDAIVIVDVDERSLSEYGQWPWPRFLLAKMNDRLVESGAAVVAYDMIFAEEDRTSPAVLDRDMKRHLGVGLNQENLPAEIASFDALFAASLRRGKTVLGCFMRERIDGDGPLPPYRGSYYTQGDGDAVHLLQQADGITASIPDLGSAAKSSAFFNTSPDFDNVIRSTPLVWALGGDRIYPALSLEAVRLYKQAAAIGIEVVEERIHGVKIADLSVPTDKDGRMLINFRAAREGADKDKFSSFPTYSAADVLQGVTADAELGGKIVFIGTSSAGLYDIRAIPLAPGVPGVEIHAAVADNILNGDALRSAKWFEIADLVVIFCVGVFLTVTIHRQKSWLSFLIALSVIILSMVGSYLLLTATHFVFVPARMIVTTIIIYPVLSMISYWRSERQERWVRGAFGSMVSSKVLSYLEENPDSVHLGGARTEATVLFADLEQFTPIAEALDADQVSSFLNSILDPLSEVITKHDGYVDKYVGDMIMAEWGVPYAVDEHALSACRAALEHQAVVRRLERDLQAKYGHGIGIRIGINSGPVVAGNMGSREKFQYTVVGDTVNLASRLEPLNKIYGTNIVIGEETYRQAGDQLETRLLDRVTVKGKQQEVEVYELIALKGEIPAARRRFLDRYEEGLRLSWEGRSDEALEKLKALIIEDPDDMPTSRLLKLLRESQGPF